MSTTPSAAATSAHATAGAHADTKGAGRAGRSNVEVMILCYNEAANLPHALESVMSWADAVYVVDSGSNDGSQEIARKAGATVMHQPWLGYARQKNWGLENLPFKGDWVFILDADESITPPLRDELLALAAKPAASIPEAGFYVNRLTKFMGKPIRHAGYYPSYNLRFFRKGTARYEDREVHEHMVVSGKTGRLRHDMLHEDRRGLEHFIAKHNRYSTLEARELMREMVLHQGDRATSLERGIAMRRWLKNKVLPRLPLSGVWRFMYMYFLRLGFLDGLAGFRFCLLLSTYDTFISLKLAELRSIGADRKPDLLESPKPAARGLAVPEGELNVVAQRSGPVMTATPVAKASAQQVSLSTSMGRSILAEIEKHGQPTDFVRELTAAIEQETRNLRHEYVGTEHILLGLVKSRSGIAKQALLNLGITSESLESHINALVSMGPLELSPKTEVGITPRTARIFEFAKEESARLSRTHIDTEHILLGLVREESGMAAQVLIDLGAKPDKVRSEIEKLLRVDVQGSSSAAPRTTLSTSNIAPVAPLAPTVTERPLSPTGRPLPEPTHSKTAAIRDELANLAFPPGKWPAKGSIPVSVLIPVKNEQRNIVDCIRHCMWASEIVVVDSQSTDQTIPMSQALNADVYQFYYSKEGWPKKKNWALEQVPWKNEWVLILDADEFMTPELTEEVRQVVTGSYRAKDAKKAGCGDGYWLNRRFMFMGRWIRGCGYYPSWNVRLFKHKVGRYERIGTLGQTGSGDNEVHEHVVLSTGPAGYLEHEFLHYAYPDLTAWIEKHNRYTTWEAHAMKAGDKGAVQASLFGGPIERRRWLKRFARGLPFRPTLRFLFSYFIQLGIRDGYPGYVMCRLLSWYEFVSLAKFYEMDAQQSDAARRDASKTSGKPVT